MLDSDFKLTDSKGSSSSDSPSSPNVSILTRHSFYHPGALLLNNEGVVFVGLLVGLAAVDFCFILKDKLDEFDSGLDTIPYHICIETHKESKTEYGEYREIAVSTDERTSFLKQNKYLEDENRKLLRRLQDASAAHTRLSESVNNLSKELGSIKLENQGFKIMLAHLKKNNPLTVNGPPKSVNGKSNSPILGQPPDLENELKQALNQVDEKTVLVDSLRGEINELQSRSVQLMRQLSSREKSLDEKQLLIRQLEGKSKGMSNIMEQMRERVSSLTNEKTSSERVIGQLRMQLKELQARVTKQDGVIQSQKDICNRLESRLSDQSDELTQLRATETKLSTYQTKIESLESEVLCWRTRCEEQETSLSEMAAVVNSSKLEADLLRESHSLLKEAQWTDDSSISNCVRCRVAFGMSRRKHHCRHCGLIFCHSCSSQTMPLASSAKPVRVCDACHALLLQRYSAK